MQDDRSGAIDVGVPTSFYGSSFSTVGEDLTWSPSHGIHFQSKRPTRDDAPTHFANGARAFRSSPESTFNKSLSPRKGYTLPGVLGQPVKLPPNLQPKPKSKPKPKPEADLEDESELEDFELTPTPDEKRLMKASMPKKAKASLSISTKDLARTLLGEAAAKTAAATRQRPIVTTPIKRQNSLPTTKAVVQTKAPPPKAMEAKKVAYPPLPSEKPAPQRSQQPVIAPILSLNRHQAHDVNMHSCAPDREMISDRAHDRKRSATPSPAEASSESIRPITSTTEPLVKTTSVPRQRKASETSRLGKIDRKISTTESTQMHVAPPNTNLDHDINRESSLSTATAPRKLSSARPHRDPVISEAHLLDAEIAGFESPFRTQEYRNQLEPKEICPPTPLNLVDEEDVDHDDTWLDDHSAENVKMDEEAYDDLMSTDKSHSGIDKLGAWYGKLRSAFINVQDASPHINDDLKALEVMLRKDQPRMYLTLRNLSNEHMLLTETLSRASHQWRNLARRRVQIERYRDQLSTSQSNYEKLYTRKEYLNTPWGLMACSARLMMTEGEILEDYIALASPESAIKLQRVRKMLKTCETVFGSICSSGSQMTRHVSDPRLREIGQQRLNFYLSFLLSLMHHRRSFLRELKDSVIPLYQNLKIKRNPRLQQCWFDCLSDLDRIREGLRPARFKHFVYLLTDFVQDRIFFHELEAISKLPESEKTGVWLGPLFYAVPTSLTWSAREASRPSKALVRTRVRARGKPKAEDRGLVRRLVQGEAHKAVARGKIDRSTVDRRKMSRQIALQAKAGPRGIIITGRESRNDTRQSLTLRPGCDSSDSTPVEGKNARLMDRAATRGSKRRKIRDSRIKAPQKGDPIIGFDDYRDAEENLLDAVTRLRVTSRKLNDYNAKLRDAWEAEKTLNDSGSTDDSLLEALIPLRESSGIIKRVEMLLTAGEQQPRPTPSSHHGTRLFRTVSFEQWLRVLEETETSLLKTHLQVRQRPGSYNKADSMLRNALGQNLGMSNAFQRIWNVFSMAVGLTRHQESEAETGLENSLPFTNALNRTASGVPNGEHDLPSSGSYHKLSRRVDLTSKAKADSRSKPGAVDRALTLVQNATSNASESGIQNSTVGASFLIRKLGIDASIGEFQSSASESSASEAHVAAEKIMHNPVNTQAQGSAFHKGLARHSRVDSSTRGHAIGGASVHVQKDMDVQKNMDMQKNMDNIVVENSQSLPNIASVPIRKVRIDVSISKSQNPESTASVPMRKNIEDISDGESQSPRFHKNLAGHVMAEFAPRWHGMDAEPVIIRKKVKDSLFSESPKSINRASIPVQKVIEDASEGESQSPRFHKELTGHAKSSTPPTPRLGFETTASLRNWTTTEIRQPQQDCRRGNNRCHSTISESPDLSTTISTESLTQASPNPAASFPRPSSLIDFHIPFPKLREALNAPPSSAAAYWKYSLYEDSDGQKVTVHYCKSLSTTERIMQLFLHEHVLGFDIEWRPQATAKHGIKQNVSLIQLASPSRIALFHVARFGREGLADLVSPTFKAVMEDPGVVKVGVAIKGDCTRLRKFMEIESQGLLELSHLYKLVKHANTNVSLIDKRFVSLATQVQEHLLLPLFKGGDVRSSDWAAELNYAQLQYAASDSYAGLQLYHTLEAKRKALSPTPPRPEFAEKDLPIRLTDCQALTIYDDGSEPVEEEIEPAGVEEMARDFMNISIEDDSERLDSTTLTPSSPAPTISRTPSSKRKPPPALSATLQAAHAWVLDHQQSKPSRDPPAPKAMPTELRAYYIWYKLGKDVSEVAAELRTPPLLDTTVAGYVINAVLYEKLDFEPEKLLGVFKIADGALFRRVGRKAATEGLRNECERRVAAGRGG